MRTLDLAIAARPTRTRRAVVETVLGVAMATVLAAGFALAVTALVAPAGQRRLAETLKLGSLLAGRTAAAVNFITAHDLPGGEVVRAIGGVWRWRLFGSGGPQVWVGRDNWLFLMDELRPWPDADAAMRRRADLLQHVGSALHAEGIDLLLVLVPDKAAVMNAMLDGPRSAQAKARHAAMLSLLQARGLKAVDLAVVFGDAHLALYYRADTHWNQIGAALAARATAGAVTTPIDHSYRFSTIAELRETQGPGDLLRLMSLDLVPDDWMIRLRPPNDREHVEQTSERDSPTPSGGLLDMPSPPDVALIGSSFSRHGNFDGRLREALGARVGNFAQVGGGFAGAAKTYFSGVAFRESPPKLVIWEIPERLVGQQLNADDAALAAVFPERG